MSALRVLVQGFASPLRHGSLRKGGLCLAMVLAMGACQQRNTEVARLIIVTPDAAHDAIIRIPTGGSGGWYDGGTGSSEVSGSDCSQANLKTDPMNCGVCGHVCAYPHGQAECVAGQCQLALCYPGYANLDKDLENGCECVKSNDGAEACDGVDNDCDGEIDEDFDFQSDPNNCGACGRVCSGAHAASACSQGQCVLDCLPGYSDADGLPEDRKSVV